MFHRLRTLHISLAAKCQLLFGAAVVLIIGAALWVPWQRMEQLTGQINERTARSLCDDTIADHLAGLPPNVRATTMPSLALPNRRTAAEPKLTLLGQHDRNTLTPFERRALKHFEDHPDADTFARLVTAGEDASFPEYRYARPLRADASCLQCHGEHPPPPLAAPVAMAGATSVPTTTAAAASQPASSIVGLVSIEMRSQVDTNQLLLNRIFLLTAGLLAGTLATIIFYLITTRLILQPVRVLQDTAEKVSEGDLNIRSHISTGDEFETLSRTFNTMLANLKESQDQLRGINKSLDLKMNQLAESNTALYESNRLKSEFLANVSHELRTPLNSILGFAELLRDIMAAPSDSRTARYVQNILTSGRNLLELINDLLDLAKIEAGRMEVRSEPLALADLFEGLTSLIRPLVEKQQLTVTATVAPDVPILLTDGPKLQQVLYNLLSNAIKFSPAQGKIELRAQRVGDEQVRISVTDEGPGIEPDQQQVIFEKFRQIDGSVTRKHGGTGLGLAISRELIGLLGGDIGVESEPGRGATFWVTLPLKITAGSQDLRRRGLVLT